MFILVVFGGIAIVCVVYLLFASAVDVVVRRYPKLTTVFNSSVFARFSLYFAIVGWTIGAWLAVPHLIECITITCSFGWDHYVDGVRIQNNRGLASNGKHLPMIWEAIYYGMETPLQFAAAIPLATFAHRSQLKNDKESQRKPTSTSKILD